MAPDEGHGFARPVNSMAMFAAIEKFLTKHLGGRHQAEMPPPVSTRLTEIAVDPKTVTLAKKVDAKAVSAPKIERQPTAGEATFQSKVEMGGQSMSLTSTVTIKQEAAGWVVTETVKTPQGDAVDVVTVEAGTLLAKSRTITQGPVKFEIGYADNKVTGSASMGGGSKPIDLDAGGPIFGEGASAQIALGALPLAPGYTVTYRTFDPQRFKLVLKQLTVLSVEQVTVPAGTFKAFKVEVKPAEGDPGLQTVWIAADTRRVVKVAATLPNGATLTSELTK